MISLPLPYQTKPRPTLPSTVVSGLSFTPEDGLGSPLFTETPHSGDSMGKNYESLSLGGGGGGGGGGENNNVGNMSRLSSLEPINSAGCISMSPFNSRESSNDSFQQQQSQQQQHQHQHQHQNNAGTNKNSSRTFFENTASNLFAVNIQRGSSLDYQSIAGIPSPLLVVCGGNASSFQGHALNPLSLTREITSELKDDTDFAQIFGNDHGGESPFQQEMNSSAPSRAQTSTRAPVQLGPAPRKIKLTQEEVLAKKTEWMERFNSIEMNCMTCSDFDGLVQSLDVIRQHDSTFSSCLCSSFESNYVGHCLKPNRTVYKNDKDRIIEPWSQLVPDCNRITDPSDSTKTKIKKWAPQIRFTEKKIQQHLQTGKHEISTLIPCDHLFLGLKQMVAFLQMYGGCTRKTSKTKVKVSVKSLLAAKKAIVGFGLESSYFTETWARSLVPGFVSKMGGIEKMVAATRLFFSKDLEEAAAAWLKKAGVPAAPAAVDTLNSLSMKSMEQEVNNFRDERTTMPSADMNSTLSLLTSSNNYTSLEQADHSDHSEHAAIVQGCVRNYVEEWNADLSTVQLDEDWMLRKCHDISRNHNMTQKAIRRWCRTTHIAALLKNEDIGLEQCSALTRSVLERALEERNDYLETSTGMSPVKKKVRSNSMRKRSRDGSNDGNGSSDY